MFLERFGGIFDNSPLLTPIFEQYSTTKTFAEEFG
jgi:hypothetical protein